MPTVDVNLFDTKVTERQKRRLAESLTEVVSDTLGARPEDVTITFRRVARMDIARAGKLGKS